MVFAALAAAVFRPEVLAGDLPSMWNRWDGPHFLELAAGGYGPPTDPARIVLFPLFPLAIRLGSVLLPPVWAALSIALIASVAAAIGLYRLISLDGSRNLAKSGVLAMVVFPTAYAFVAPYSEALFLALAVWSFVAIRRDDVRLAGILGALAALTRIQGIFLLPALALEYFLARRRIDRDFVWILFVGSGLLAYLAINQVYFGDPLHFVAVQRDTFFVRNVLPWDAVSTLVSGVVSGQWNEGWVTTYVAPLASLVLLGAVTVWCLVNRASRPSYALYAAISLVSFATLSFPISVPRYLLGVFPIFIALGSWFRSSFGPAVMLGSVLLLGLFTTLFVIGHWAF
jgi:Gpi18-like mannosyltransferase